MTESALTQTPLTQTVDITLKPSGRALRWLFLFHAAPLAVLPFALDPGQPMVLIAGAIAVSWLWLRRHPSFGYGPRALVHLIWHAEGQWTVTDAGGRAASAELLGNSIVRPRLLVLNFKLGNGLKRTRIVLGDEAKEEPLRRLRARLMMNKS